MSESDYGALFREGYTLLHGGGPTQAEEAVQRGPDESIEQYLSRTRSQSLEATARKLRAAEPPTNLRRVHDLMLELLTNAVAAEEALTRQIHAYQCGQFHESVSHSDALQSLVTESQRLDRDLISELRHLPTQVRETLGIELGLIGL